MHSKSLGWIALAAAGIAGCSSTAARQPEFAVRVPEYAPLYVASQASQAAPAAPTNWPMPQRQPPYAGQPFASAPSPLPTAHAVRCVSDEEPIAPGVKQPSTGRPPRLEVPEDLPGAQAPAISLPRFDAANPQPRQRAVAALFPDLPPLGPEFVPPTRPGVRALSLADVESIAREHSPAIRQAAANVRAAMGAAVQAGLYPNPNFGYEADNINTGNTAGFQGAFFEQAIKTGGKLQLARASAMVGVENAQVALRKANVDLAHQVRGAYFAAVVAQENVRVSRALVKFTEEAYHLQVEMTKGGQATVYEPMQLRVLAFQARSNLVQARNRYTAAWKQLAAAAGVPGLPPAPLSGSVDAPVPLVRYDAALVRVLNEHTDVLTALNNIRQARVNVELAYANRIPDISTHVAVQKDYTAPPFGAAVNVAVGIPLPIWDRNQGNIEQAEAQLASAVEGPHATRDDLTNRLADAFERYDDNRTLVEYYNKHILPDQVQAFRGIRQRYEIEPDAVAFSDIVNAQQTLATSVSAYVTTLGSLWTAVVDLAALLEADDLARLGQPESVPPIPDIEQIAPLPCCHPTPLWQNRVIQTGDGRWPSADLGK